MPAEQLKDRDIPGPKRDYVGYGRRLPKVVWPDEAQVAVNLVVNYEEGSEYAKPLGDERNEGLAEINYALNPKYRDLSTESVYEYGSRAGIWRLLRLFDEYRIQTTFFACAVALERNPEVGQWMQASGHEPCSHGWRRSEHWLLSRDEERQQLRWAGLSSRSRTPAVSVPRAGTVATDRASTPASCWSRRAALCTTRTPITTTCPTSPR